MAKRLVVIGGTAAGLSAASKAKRSYPELDVTVFERTCYTSYGACGLPYFAGNMIRDARDLIALTPEKLQAERDIAVLLHHEVIRIDRETISASINLRAETISRKLKELEREGMVALEGHRVIRLLDADGLRAVFEASA